MIFDIGFTLQEPSIMFMLRGSESRLPTLIELDIFMFRNFSAFLAMAEPKPMLLLAISREGSKMPLVDRVITLLRGVYLLLLVSLNSMR